MVIYLFCSLLCTFAKEVQLFPRTGLGLYSGIFALYLQLECQSNKSRMAKIVFYALCLLHVLSTLSFVSDLVGLIYLTLLQVSNNSICKNNIFLSVV